MNGTLEEGKRVGRVGSGGRVWRGGLLLRVPGVQRVS